MTQPIGTSPALAAFSAVFSAKSMKEGAFTPRIIWKNLLLRRLSAKVDFRLCVRRASDQRAYRRCPATWRNQVRPLMPRDDDKNNDSRGRRERSAGGKGRSGKPRGPEKKFAKRGFGPKKFDADGDKPRFRREREDRPFRRRDGDEAPRRFERDER